MSTFKCTNNSCALSTSGASFPAAMPCPVCQQPLQTSVSLTVEDEQLLVRLPYVIACPLKATLLEENGWTRINLLKDTLQNYLKFLGLLSASEFFNDSNNSRNVVDAFHRNLAEPSFGTWNAFTRECLQFLNEHEHAYKCPELALYYQQVETGKKRKLLKGEIEITDMHGETQLKNQQATRIGMLINFRNRYLGHGLTLDHTESMRIWEEYWPIMRELLDEMQFADTYRMYRKDGKQALLLHGREITEVPLEDEQAPDLWLQTPIGDKLPILPFYISPGELAVDASEQSKVWIYEAYTGRTLKFFRPEGNLAKESSGQLVQRLNQLLKAKAVEQRLSPEELTEARLAEMLKAENTTALKTLEAERKIIPGIYQHRNDMEAELRAWVGAMANVCLIAASAGSGKTNLLVEMLRQYTERGLNTYLLRAARMECSTLQEELQYQLCLRPDVPLAHCPMP